MATPIVIPREGQSMESATIVDWLVQVGEKVSFAQPICTVESEKAAYEIESPVEGTLLEVFYSAGETAPVLKTIAVVGDAGEDYSDLIPKNDTANQQEKVVEIESDKSAPAEDDADMVIDEQETRRVLVSPRAKKLIKEKGLSVHEIKVNPITEKDVLDYIEAQPDITPAALERIQRTGESLPSQGTGIGGRITIDDLYGKTAEDSGITISGMRKTIADRMHSSLQKTAQFTLNCYADATNILNLRKQLKNSELEIENVTINDIVLFVVAKALADFPNLNAYFSEGIYTKKDQVNLGVAVEIEGGLMVPVVSSANELSLNQLSITVKKLAVACKTGEIRREDLSGGTFTVSNLGNLGINSFTPILNYPEVGILGVGAIDLKPVRTDDGVKFIEHMALSLTVNHQVIDGAEGARFLSLVSKYLKNVNTLLAL